MASENTELISFFSIQVSQVSIYFFIAERVFKIAHQFINYYEFNFVDKAQDEIYNDEYEFFLNYVNSHWFTKIRSQFKIKMIFFSEYHQVLYKQQIKKNFIKLIHNWTDYFKLKKSIVKHKKKLNRKKQAKNVFFKAFVEAEVSQEFKKTN